MVQNPERRTVLADAAIEVLARDGARGLTFRAVDGQAGVPAGTASNYFASRNALLAQAAERIHVRLRPDDATVAEMLRTRPAPSPGVLERELTAMYHRLAGQQTDYLALLELRLEAIRRPEVRASLTATMRANLERNIAAHRESGLPGDDVDVVLMYLALSWLIIENLTLPGVLDGYDADRLITALTELVAARDHPRGHVRVEP
ncbi:TetR/AcrR family transcriptional regulator [Jiangella mangrovi]|uniref:DNA-binding transcriptional regulator YbjK n=1 Tax=Jiangella mangrovi TaxID=1524084 RepID=A0A7W9GXD0_9ACTN|nr:TetR/AcrR family transcriptional regulator [Jiangella mangrovi]MBB5791499.1 DNA-binding transcriptional regulator YbjK [Jiangella mangrovi]